MEVARSEAVEADLDRFIRTRHDWRVAEEGERPAREMWEELERRYEEQRQRENRAAWYGWHLEHADRHRRTLDGLIAFHAPPRYHERRAVGSIDSRLRRLEERPGGACPECRLPPQGPRYLVMISESRPEESFRGDPEERCGSCGLHIYTVTRVVYEGAEGGGDSYWPHAPE